MTAFLDLYDQAVTCASQAALDAYLGGIDAALSLDHTGFPELERAIELDPEFAMAHVLLARQSLVYGQGDRVERRLAMQKALLALRRDVELGRRTAWLFSLVGLTDLAVVGGLVAYFRVEPGSLGAMYFIVVAIVPGLLLTHLLIIERLRQASPS